MKNDMLGAAWMVIRKAWQAVATAKVASLAAKSSRTTVTNAPSKRADVAWAQAGAKVVAMEKAVLLAEAAVDAAIDNHKASIVWHQSQVEAAVASAEDIARHK